MTAAPKRQGRGMHIAVLGPDGSGKSTAGAEARRRLAPHFRAIDEYHWRPSALPDLGVLLGRREAEPGAVVTDPHSKARHRPAVSLFRLAYYLADYWLGYLPRILLPRLRGRLVFFDRYAGDMWCDPRRYRLGLPSGLLRALCRCAPEPDLTFVLVADPQTLLARKAEVSELALKEMLERYEAFARSGKRHIRIDVTRPLDEVASQIESAVLAWLA